MWDLIVSVPDHCLSVYFGCIPSISSCDTSLYQADKPFLLKFSNYVSL